MLFEPSRMKTDLSLWLTSNRVSVFEVSSWETFLSARASAHFTWPTGHVKSNGSAVKTTVTVSLMSANMLILLGVTVKKTD